MMMYLFARCHLKSTTNWVAKKKTEIHYLTVLEARSMRKDCQQGWFLLFTEGKSVPSLSLDFRWFPGDLIS